MVEYSLFVMVFAGIAIFGLSFYAGRLLNQLWRRVRGTDKRSNDDGF